MGYIFESEIESIMHAVRARTIGEEESITLAHLLASDIHPAIKAYFRAEVQRMLHEERKNEVRSKKFPYGQPEVVRLQNQIDLLLMSFYEFNQHEFDALLDHAVHFQFNYLCRPQWTLMGFVFENQRRISSSIVLRKFDYCIDYIYFKEIIKRLIEDRGLAEITYEEFREVLKKIDREVVAQHSSIELARLTRPILKFMEATYPHGGKKTIEEEATLPINAAVVFFEDKELNEIKLRLETERDKNGVTVLTMVQLADLIEKTRTGNEEAKASLALTEPEAALPKIPVGVMTEGSRWDSTVKGREAIDKGPVSSDQFKQVDREQGESVTESEILVPLEEVGEEQLDRDLSDLEDVHLLFTKSEQRMFIKKIFHKDEVEFRNALDALNKIASWKEASLYLDQIFVANDIDPFSKDAIRFTDKIQSRYRPPDEENG